MSDAFVGALVASEREKSSEAAAKLSAAFEASAKKTGVFQETLKIGGKLGRATTIPALALWPTCHGGYRTRGPVELTPNSNVRRGL